MRSFIKIALLVFYVFFNAGLSYSMHFCGDDYQRINLYGEGKTCCPNEEPMPDCCEDIGNIELPNSDQQFVDALDFQFLQVKDIPLLHEFLFTGLEIIREEEIEFADSSPPFLHKTPIYINNQVFLI